MPSHFSRFSSFSRPSGNPVTALPYATGSWLIQTELEPDRDQDWDKDQYYVEHFTLQLKQDQDHSYRDYCKYPHKFNSLGAEWLGKPFTKFLVPFKFPHKIQCEGLT